MSDAIDINNEVQQLPDAAEFAEAADKYSGRGKYSSDIPPKVAQLYRCGASKAEIAVYLNICTTTFDNWVRKHSAFADAVRCGLTLSSAVWHREGRLGALGLLPINARLYVANMKNRFGWREHLAVEGMPEMKESLEKIQAIADKIKKHERDY